MEGKQVLIGPRELAEWMQKADELREESYCCSECDKRWDEHEHSDTNLLCADGGHSNLRYQKDWHACCKEAGMPEVWAKLIAPYLSLGYCDVWDWCTEVMR